MNCLLLWLFLPLAIAAYAQTPAVPPPAATPGQTLPTPTVPGITPPSGMPANVPNTNVVDDKKFLKEIAAEELLQIELSKLASQKAISQDVKQLAGTLVTDLSGAKDQLAEIAAHKSVAIPAALDSKQQGRIDKLAKLSGKQFEKLYLRDQLDDQEADVKRFRAEKERGQDPDVMSFAAASLPGLEKNLEASKALRKSWKPK